jgi:hypothetical protein
VLGPASNILLILITTQKGIRATQKYIPRTGRTLQKVDSVAKIVYLPVGKIGSLPKLSEAGLTPPSSGRALVSQEAKKNSALPILLITQINQPVGRAKSAQQQVEIWHQKVITMTTIPAGVLHTQAGAIQHPVPLTGDSKGYVVCVFVHVDLSWCH